MQFYKKEDEKPLVTDSIVINQLSYLNLFECGKNFLNKLDATCEQVCMETSKDKYYTEIQKTLTD